MAVKSGGDDQDSNVLLRRAIQNAKAVQMPKDKIQNAIKKGMDRDTSEYEDIVYEGMAPHGIAVVVETATDNPQRTVANVRSYFRKKGGSLGTQGMHDFIFDRKGVFYIKKEDIKDLEETEFELIDYGLESIEEVNEEDTDFYKIYVKFEDFGKMQDSLEELGYKIEKTDLDRIPTHTKELSDDEVDEVLALIDLIEQDDDVNN
ncbi:unnamed protein product, partial [Cyprideis torosa]